jgi:hypothetical protein
MITEGKEYILILPKTPPNKENILKQKGKQLIAGIINHFHLGSLLYGCRLIFLAVTSLVSSSNSSRALVLYLGDMWPESIISYSCITPHIEIYQRGDIPAHSF